MARPHGWLAALSVLLLLTGCGLFDSGSSPAPTATAEPPPSSGRPEEPGPPPVTPDPPGTVYDAVWSLVEPPQTLEAVELPSPFSEFLDVPAVWRLYIVEGDAGEAQLLQETGRWLQHPVWGSSDETLGLTYPTRVEGSASFIRGHQQLDVATGAVNWDLLTDLEPSFSMSPDGTRFVVTERSGRPFNRGPRMVWQPGGEALVIESFTAEPPVEWSPDGQFIVATGYPGPVTTPQEQARDYYLLEPGRNEVVFIGRSPQGSSLNTAWSPDNRKIAFTLGENLVIFDVTTRRNQTIPLGAGFQSLSEPSWSADGKYLAVEDGVVDATAGHVLLPPSSPSPAEPGASPIRNSAVSPGGTKLAWTESIYTSDCEGLQSTRAWLKDVATGEARVLLDCGQQVFVDVEWIDAAHLLVRSADCDQCESRYFGIKLFSVLDGSLLDLTEGQEDSAAYAISPDRSRVLVGGAKLRIYDSAGTLLRVIEPPEGSKVTGLSWSNDGSRVVYVVGPEDAFLP